MTMISSAKQRTPRRRRVHNDGTANTNRAVKDSDTDMQGDMFLDSSDI
jgi:hypothetical protein